MLDRIQGEALATLFILMRQQPNQLLERASRLGLVRPRKKQYNRAASSFEEANMISPDIEEELHRHLALLPIAQQPPRQVPCIF
jgi:hypothetical protein